MTETEWMACASEVTMLRFLKDRISDRKLRLFAIACCLRAWGHLLDGWQRTAIQLAERYADGVAPTAKLADAWKDAEHHAAGYPIDEAMRAAVEVLRPDAYEAAWWMMSHVRIAMVQRARTASSSLGATPGLEQMTPFQAGCNEARLQRSYLWDISGGLFRSLPPCPEAIAPLAEDIYAGRWELMPLLGEWLQEHGFWQEGEHCLDPALRHVKGCYVLDWVLGKE
jgi:hypothetical protein